MKSFKKLSVLLACLALSLMSMECDRSPEPPHVKYISYTISAELDAVTYVGPIPLTDDIKAWVDDNEVYYDLPYEYSTGAASEFTKYDTQALSRYEPFKKKFLEKLDDFKDRLSKNAYGKDVTVKATYRVFAERGQGQDRVLKSETVTFSYP